MTRRPAGARSAALHALVAVERGRVPRLAAALDLGGLPPRDRAFAFELAQGTERMHLALDFVIAQSVDRAPPADPLLRSALRLGIYQLLFATRVPARAAVHETVALLARNRPFANAVLRRVAGSIVDRPAGDPRCEWPLPGGAAGPRALAFAQPVLPPPGTPEACALRHGLPAFLVAGWFAAFGAERAAAVCAASSRAPSVMLRAFVPQDELAAELALASVRTEPVGARSLRVVAGDPFATAAFAAGRFVAQDPTASAAADAVAAQPGETVLDLCAAPGTKTAVLAAAVGAAGRVLAFDPDESRRPKILDNARRLGFAERVTVLASLRGAPAVDRVLADVPCSNTGVLARRVEVRRRLDPAALDGFPRQQRAILAQALDLCRPAGRAVYSTCSIEDAENRQVVAAVLADRAGCRLVEERLTLPGDHDGGYFAVLEVKSLS